MNARQTRASAVRRQCRIGKIKRTEELLRRVINEHRLLEPMQCDIEFMGTDYQPKMAAYRSRHDLLLQAFAELTCERMAMQEPMRKQMPLNHADKQVQCKRITIRYRGHGALPLDDPNLKDCTCESAEKCRVREADQRGKNERT